MEIALKIIEREIAQRELANQHKNNLRKVIIDQEINSLKRVVELVKNNDLLHNVMLGLEGRELFPEQIERAKRFFSMLGKEIDEA